ncbi:MAG: PKD domain-containing protein, partial [Bacteroidales bacterium]
MKNSVSFKLVFLLAFFLVRFNSVLYGQCPAVVAAVPSNTTMCQSGPVVLTATANPGSTFQWYSGTTLIADSTKSTLTVTTNGIYKVKTEPCGSFSIPMTVAIKPVPTITGNNSPCIGVSGITYTTEASMTGYTWTLPLGGGSIVSGASTNIITVLWDTPGNKTVSVNYINSNGCTAVNSTILNINVNALPIANFTFTPNSQCSPMTVSFSNSSTGSMPLSFSWNFDDPSSVPNNTSTSTNPTHLYIASFGGGIQTYLPNLTVTDANGCSNFSNKTISAKQIPDASISDVFMEWKHCVVGSDTAYTLEINNTSATTASNTHYHIDWGDSKPPYDATVLPDGTAHLYNTIGNFPVVLTVNNTNCSATKNYYFFNGSNPKGGIVNPGNTQGLCGLPQPITFTFDTTTLKNPPGTIYTVVYDDGSPTEIYSQPPPPSVLHNFILPSCGHTSQYPTPNSFSIKCTASNPCGISNSIVDPIQISAKPIASFNPSPLDNTCINTEITFTSTSIPIGFVNPGTNACNTSLIHTWAITPSTYSISNGNLHSTNLTVKFNATGTYSVTLVETSGCQSVPVTKTICIAAPPTPLFTLDNPTGCKPLNVNTNNTTVLTNLCSPITYLWDVTYTPTNGCPAGTGTAVTFRESTSYSSASPKFTLNLAGTYAIKLNMTNSCGTFSSAIQTVTVKAPPSVTNLTLNPPSPICSGGSVSSTAVFANCNGTTPMTYTWSFAGGSPVSSNQQIPGAINYLNTGTIPVTNQIEVFATNECGISTINTTSLVVNPNGQVIQPPSQEICNGASTSAVNFATVNTGGITTYSWINTQPTIGLAATG